MTRKLYTTQMEIPDGMIDFGVGQPGPSIMPKDLTAQAFEHRMAQDDTLLLTYGPEQGDGPFLEALAAFLTQGYGMSVDPLSLMVTGGASQALDMISTFFAKPGDTVFVEEPTYFIAPRIFRDHNLNVVGLPMDEEGLRIDVLEERLKEIQPAFVYTIPAYQNPSGITLSPERRQRLVELSVEHGFYILADEVYQLLNYTDTPPPPLAAYVESDTVFSIGSFSKIWGPGLRLGWIQAGPTLMDKLIEIGFVFSGGALNQFSSHIMRSALSLGLQTDYLVMAREIYGKRINALCDAMDRYWGHSVTYRKPTGGYFVWVQLPDAINAVELNAAAEANHVAFKPGVRFSSHEALPNFMRLCFAYYDSAGLIEGVQRIGKALSKVGTL